MLWSLKFCWGASQHDAIAPKPQVRLFVLFDDPALTPQPPHSTGLSTRQPIWPQGYAEPDKQPRHLQIWSEIMAGRIPQAPDQAIHPSGLIDALIGKETAREIGLWREK